MFKPVVDVSFSVEQLELLSLLSSNHYDFTCKAMSKHGGLLYGALSRCVYETEEKLEISATRLELRDIDLLLKILEIRGYFDYCRELGDALRKQMKGLIKAIDESHPDSIEVTL